MSVDVWFGLCENSHNAKAKNKEYKNIVKFYVNMAQSITKCLYIFKKKIDLITEDVISLPENDLWCTDTGYVVTSIPDAKIIFE